MKYEYIDVNVTKLDFISTSMVIMLTQFFVSIIKNGVNGSITIDERKKSNKYLRDIKIIEFCNSNYVQPHTISEISSQTAMPIKWITTETLNSYITMSESYFGTFCRDKDLTILNICISELINNVYDHSGSEIGAYIFCQYYPTLNRISVVTADLGIGIPTKVNQYLCSIGKEKMSSKDCIEWALTENNTSISTPRNKCKLPVKSGRSKVEIFN
ncbi:MAG: hypothetical protein MUF42_16870 [Cytophagaceae bacterium]|jgi:phage-related holin|nr:hypothetical protein [Cytophagaceae bacterium]